LTDTDTSDRWISLANRIAQEVLSPHADDVDQKSRWPAEAVSALGESGLLGLAAPASFGGGGAGPRTFAAVTRLLAERCASTGMIYVMHVCATQVIAAAPSFPLKEGVLCNIAAGRQLSTLALSERGSRSHFWVPMNPVRHEGDTDVLSAEKSFVTSAGHADSYVVSMRSSRAAAPTDSTLYFVPRDAVGLRVCGAWNGLGLRGNASAPVQLEQVRVPASHRISGDGVGFPLTMSAVLPWFQLGSAAVSVGIARAATGSIRQHLLNARLEHLEQSLASLPNLRMRLAQMQIAVDTQEAFLDHVAGQMENPGPNTLLTVLESKAAAAEAALAVTDLAMRTGGGASFARRLSVERNFRDARASSIMAPTTDVLHDFVGKTLLEMPLL
jgi:alkylation response protein AidB-like acyl-CoA dehydrogenase